MADYVLILLGLQAFFKRRQCRTLASPAGHLEGVHLSDTHLVPESVVVWESESYVFGRFQHVLKMADVVGNRSTGPWPTFADTVNSAPRPLKRFEKTGYDAVNDQVIFSIEPRLPLAEAN